jgi:hypothetical protein
MRWLATLLSAFALLAFFVVGCNQVTAETAPLTLTVRGFDPRADSQVPLKDVQFCETGTNNCVPTDASGEATLQLPANTETSYTLEKEGWASYLVGEVIRANGEEYVFTMDAEQFFVEQHDLVMSPYPMRDTGTIQLYVSPAFGGATYELFGATGKPYYVHEQGDWRLDLTETTSRGGGGFTEVGPGDFQVNLGGTAERCTPTSGWPGDAANSIRFPVREGYISAVDATCQIPSTAQIFVSASEATSVSSSGDSIGPAEGVEVCETDTINCVETDADGEARLTLPRDEVVSYTLSKDGYTPWLVADVTEPGFAAVNSTGWIMFSEAQMAELAADLMMPYPWTGGWIALRAFPRMAGVTFDLVGETATGYYNDEAGTVRLDLTATTSGGDGGFLEVTPGEHQLEFGGTATGCVASFAWPGDAPNQIKVPVKVGYITWGTMRCDDQ